MNTPRLENKVIVIIGGTSGLGLSAAQACVSQGAAIVAVGRRRDKCEAARAMLGRSARVVEGDATRPETAEAAVRMAVEEFGALDGLYHVAGGSGRSYGDGPLHEISDQGWDYTLRLNLDSLFFSNRAAARQFLAQSSPGAVLNMTSVLAYSPAPRYFGTHAYATTKTAAIGLTKASAAYYARHDIRFNALAPSLVDTPLAQRASSDPDIMRYVASKQPLGGGRIGQTSDLDQAVVFLLSDESRFVTGQVLAVDGGWSVTEGQYDEPPGPSPS